MLPVSGSTSAKTGVAPVMATPRAVKAAVIAGTTTSSPGPMSSAASSPPQHTPVIQQYLRVKGEHPDTLLFFRMGDFYELFHDDAKVAAKALGITLTARGKGESAVPMAGVPVRAVDGYLRRLVAAGSALRWPPRSPWLRALRRPLPRWSQGLDVRGDQIRTKCGHCTAQPVQPTAHQTVHRAGIAETDSVER